MTWQPIETAPGDGESVLLWYEGHDHPAFGMTFKYGDGTVSASSSMVRGVQPTHWMPLPLPPQKDKGE